MRNDIAAVFWKEWREILTLGGTRGKLGMLIFAVAFGVLLPLQNGRAWVESPVLLLFWVWMPLFMVSSVIADSIAGERERHTLETLLASRLPDHAILLGKAATAISYGVALTWFNLLVGLVTVNIAFGAGKLVMYTPAALAMIVLVSILGAGLSAGAGILVSLRATTVRQAQQTLSIAMLLLFVLPIMSIQFLSAQTQAQLKQVLAGIDPVPISLIAGAVLLLADVLLMVVALARFKRARLILD